MTIRKRADVTLNVLLTLLFLPARAVEEGLHAIAAMPWAERVRVDVNPRGGTAETRVHYRENTPSWAITAAYVIPEVVGISAGVAVIGYWLLAGPVWLPTTTLDWILLSLLGAQWLAVALPSAADTDHTPEGSR